LAGEPPAEFVPLLEEIAAAVRSDSLRTQLFVMAEADQRDLLSRIAVPTLLIWGELDARSPLSVARQFDQAIPHTKLVVIPGAGHVSNLEQPEQFNEAEREFCRAHPRVSPKASGSLARRCRPEVTASAGVWATRPPAPLSDPCRTAHLSLPNER
jgi:hypothetical protein